MTQGFFGGKLRGVDFFIGLDEVCCRDSLENDFDHKSMALLFEPWARAGRGLAETTEPGKALGRAGVGRNSRFLADGDAGADPSWIRRSARM